jgi:hypothetical protein
MCQMGEYANVKTNTCDKCAVGYASAALRATSCAPCNGGRYSDKEGAVMCSACKEGFTTPRDKQPHTACVVAPPEPETLEEAKKNATANGMTPESMREMDDTKFEELFEDLEEKSDAVFGASGRERKAGGKAAGGRAAAITDAAMEAAGAK